MQAGSVADPSFRKKRADGSGRLWRDGFWTVLFLVVVLYGLDPLELFSSPTAVWFLPAGSHDPGPSIERGIDLATAVDPPFASNDGNSKPLFGADTEPVTTGALVEKWSEAATLVNKDLEVVEQCRVTRSCPAPARRLIDLSLQGAGRSDRARVGLINRAIDLAISPVSDEAQWGVQDHWSDPFETLRSNAGDCEDYAIVKYAALLVTGFPRDAVKIVVLRSVPRNEDHAVVAVRVDNRWLLLDNRTLTLVQDTDLTRATPEFVLDHQGVRRFVTNGRGLKAV